MQITHVHLKNVKSYADQLVAFAEGTNAICGQNGAGKTTLLEAIGFTLFDYLPYSQSDFVREGQNSASVTIHLISGLDERTYHVHRRCGTQHDYFVYDPELDARLVSGKADVQDWLREHLRLEPNADIPSLFHDAVGVPQGLLTSVFLETPARRKITFDRLLQVDEYEQVWNGLLQTVNRLKEKTLEQNAVIAGLEGRVERLPGLQDQAQAGRDRLAEIDGRLAELASDLAATGQRRQSLEAIQDQIERLQQEISQRQARSQGLDEQIDAARQAVSRAQAAREIVDACQPAFESYTAAQLELARLQGDRTQRDRLRNQLQKYESGLSLRQAELDQLRRNLDEIEAARAEMKSLAAQVERQADLEQELEQLRQQANRLEIATARARDLETEREKLQDRLIQVEQDLDRTVQINQDLADAKTRLEELKGQLLEIAGQQAAAAAEDRRLAGQSTALESADSASCPVCEQPLSEQHRTQILDASRVQRVELEARLAQLVERQAGLAEEARTAEHTIQSLEARLLELPRPAARTELEERVSALESDLSAVRADMQALAGSPAQLAAAQADLTALDDPRGRSRHLENRVAARTQIENSIDEKNREISETQAALSGLTTALNPFENLDQELAEQQAVQQANEDGRNRYLENRNAAAELPQHQERVASLETAKTETRTQLKNLLDRRRELDQEFDAQELADIRQHEKSLEQESAKLTGQADTIRQQLGQVQHEIEELEAAQHTLDAARQTAAHQIKMLDLLQFFRKTIRDAGPHVVRRLVQHTSWHATRLYTAIMSDPVARLLWAEDYGIHLEQAGRQRGFEQLSGGEQMTAALGVRLALLRELSNIDVAFFDEPTANLDDERRQNLAEQISAVLQTGFRQIFVISHDDTFEQATDHVIRVWKENGESRVEVG